MSHKLWQKFAAELFGTYALMLTIGLNAVQANPLGPIAVGAILMNMIYMFGSVSRAQFNPSVTLAFLTLGRKLITAHEALWIWLAEYLGASLAAVTFYLLTLKPGSVPLFEFNGASACFEVIWTAILVLVILNINTCQADSKLSGGFFNGGVIALTVVAAAYSAGSIAPAYLNPCVTFGIAVAHLIGTGGTDATATRLFGFMAVQFAASILAVFIFPFTNGARELKAEPLQAEKQEKEVTGTEKERLLEKVVSG
ncbi:unnamed protein product [Vitrella brassicaformis CCMP3155]|uniref:Aquaporin n=1 Tax=Vitrella brassicaformis (strain CCMP3155) TaxID=1169540 RepID=A0A0G4GVP8_VITBC|nr:unnamed protein product [Vitrella brassicaformis CCMP3155]|eukprot:CEM35029.1 unnamed protein product [Vitrella brassicaformis CCMP3155]